MAGDKITFLGSGGGRVVVSNQDRCTAGFVINHLGYQIQVDPGPGALVRTKVCGIKAADNDVVFVSHKHIDHVNDLNVVVDAMTLGGIHKRGIIISVPSVIEGHMEQSWLHPRHRSFVNECISVKKGDVISLAHNLKMTLTPTNHDEPHEVGFRLDSPTHSIGYTADTAPFKGLAEVFKGCSVLIVNVLKPDGETWPTHMCTHDVVDLLIRVKPELAILSGFGAKMIRSDPMYQARYVQQKTGVRTIAADDGMVVDISGIQRTQGHV